MFITWFSLCLEKTVNFFGQRSNGDLSFFWTHKTISIKAETNKHVFTIQVEAKQLKFSNLFYFVRRAYFSVSWDNNPDLKLYANIKKPSFKNLKNNLFKEINIFFSIYMVDYLAVIPTM